MKEKEKKEPTTKTGTTLRGMQTNLPCHYLP